MQWKKPLRNGVVHGIRCSLRLLCLLLCVCFCCGAAAESSSAEKESAKPGDEEVIAWREILGYLEPEEWGKFEGVATGDPWFVTCRLPGNVYAIMEPLHEQYAIAFLIIGEEKALLLDTCTGIQNIRRVVDILTDLPVTVLISHDHFDHTGGIAYFDEVWCYDESSAIQHLTQGPTEAELHEALDSTKSIHSYLKFYGLPIPETIPGKAPTGTVEDGQAIDLGGRILEVIYMPGHDSSCIMLLDRDNQLLFTGDMFYPGPMFCMFDDSSFPDYVRSIRKAADLALETGIDDIFCSHNRPSVAAEDLCRFANYLEAMERGEITDYDSTEGRRVYWMDPVYSIEFTEESTEPVSE